MHRSADLDLECVRFHNILNDHARLVVDLGQVEICLSARLRELIDGQPEKYLPLLRAENVLRVHNEIGRMRRDLIPPFQLSRCKHSRALAVYSFRVPWLLLGVGFRVDAIRSERLGILKWRQCSEFFRYSRCCEYGDASSVAECGIGVDAQFRVHLAEVVRADRLVCPWEI